MDLIFDACVELLVWLADVTGATCKQINVIVFCILWPLVTLGLAGLCWHQRRTIRRLRTTRSAAPPQTPDGGEAS